MSVSTRRTRRQALRSLGAAALAGTAMLAAGCGGASSGRAVTSSEATTTAGAYSQALAFAQCMRAHGLKSFPTPKPSQGSGAAPQLTGSPNSPAARALAACKHLLPAAGTGTGGTATTAGPPGFVDCLSASQCYAAHQFAVAYGIQPLRDSGINGRGVTVALPEEAETGPARPQPLSNILQSVTDIRHDLAYFDKRFGLPPARIQAITTLAGSSASPWLASVEEVEDTELVHAVAPNATIREVLVDPADVKTRATFAAAFGKWVRLAVSNGEVISQSGMGQDFNLGEHAWTNAEVAKMDSALKFAASRHVTVVVATGDYGAIGHGSSTPVREVSLPASDPLALAAGGTRLTANPVTGAYRGETTWNTQSGPVNASSSGAGGGGFSRLFARPAYQNGVPGIGTGRGVPDVAGDASSDTGGMALAFSAPGGGHEFIGAGGTSAAAPFWAALIALADQTAGHPLGLVNPAIYRIAHSPQYHKAFHDITTGNNTVALNGHTITGYKAGPGWDPATGWGSPNAQTLVPLLARYAKS